MSYRNTSYKRFNPADLPVDQNLLNETPLHGELNIENIVFLQINRTSLSATQDESIFASNTRILLSMVPNHKRGEIFDKYDEYTSTIKRYQYKYWCGVPLGIPENPVNGSPALIEEEVTDWHKLFEIILVAFEECGLTWKADKLTIEVGKVEQETSYPPPTPVFANRFERPLDQQQEEQSTSNPDAPERYARPCAICGQHVGKNTGQYYKHKIVHKNECLDIAKTKWGVDDPNVQPTEPTT